MSQPTSVAATGIFLVVPSPALLGIVPQFTNFFEITKSPGNTINTQQHYTHHLPPMRARDYAHETHSPLSPHPRDPALIFRDWRGPDQTCRHSSIHYTLSHHPRDPLSYRDRLPITFPRPPRSSTIVLPPYLSKPSPDFSGLAWLNPVPALHLSIYPSKNLSPSHRPRDPLSTYSPSSP
jgi:hypothetical protein